MFNSKIERLVELLEQRDFMRLAVFGKIDLSDYIHEVDILFAIMFDDPIECYEAFMKNKTKENKEKLEISLFQSNRLFNICQYKTNLFFQAEDKNKVLDHIKSIFIRDEIFSKLGSSQGNYYNSSDIREFFMKFSDTRFVELCVSMLDTNDLTYKNKSVPTSCATYFDYLIAFSYTQALTEEQINKLIFSSNYVWLYDSYLYEFVIRYNEKSIERGYKTSFPFDFIYDSIMYSETLPPHKLISLLEYIFDNREFYSSEINKRAWFSDAEENLLKKHRSVEPFLIKITNSLGNHTSIAEALLYYKNANIITCAVFWYIKENLANENRSNILQECENLAIELAKNDNRICYILFCEEIKKEELADQIILKDKELNRVFHKKVEERIQKFENFGNTYPSSGSSLEVDMSLFIPTTKPTRRTKRSSFVPPSICQ